MTTSKSNTLSFRTVVLDGSNIIWGGSEGEEPVILRLFEAIGHYERLGYEVIPVVRTRMFNRITRTKGKKETGHKQLKRLRSEGKLRLAEDDDKLVIDLAIDKYNPAWMVTQDTFKDKPDGTKKERTLHPELPWDDIDDRTIGTHKDDDGWIKSGQHWSVSPSGSEFNDTFTKKAPPSFLFSRYDKVRQRTAEARNLLEKIQGDLDTTQSEGREDPLNKMRNQASRALDKVYALEATIPEPELPSDEQLRGPGVTVPRLKEMCRGLGLGVSGVKDDLIQRIIGHRGDIEAPEAEDSTDKHQHGDIDREKFAKSLHHQMDDPERWEAFTTPYEKLIKSNPEYNLKKSGIKPMDFLYQCSDWIEVEIRNDHPWIRGKK